MHPELLLAALLIAVLLAAIAMAIPRRPRVRAKALLTKRERVARVIIERVLPHARIYVQVSMGALLQPKAGLGRNEAMRTRNRFSQKIVDFVIEDRASGAVLALVELDDRSHDAPRDRQRDAMTASAGYRTIRLPAGKLTTADIAARLQPLQPSNAGTSVSATRSGA
ncbi:DUF2726 domain-containing protein [Sphingomonas sp. CROZ-RG-20F-R02-07]|uniref:DUF2726 domain-containing protein n=1 Tax=Sphingomonas sp. CROZ-RG-20F-R02-07 TaxID=2914832 RepID=UPI001F58F442|nr:DUF2726 domain-containing protein [Sphingomonas sp. CROZ-RG-20F-R02-07]